jgi:hypothetical protein
MTHNVQVLPKAGYFLISSPELQSTKLILMLIREWSHGTKAEQQDDVEDCSSASIAANRCWVQFIIFLFPPGY